MKKTITFCTIVGLLASCGGTAPQNKNLDYNNIVIISDLSSRMDNKPSKDTDEIHKLIAYFKNECVKPGQKIGDRSCISFSLFSERVIAEIDLDKHRGTADKQQFINSTGTYQHSGLDAEISQFEEKVKSVYASKRNRGLDLISLLIEKIKKEPIVKRDTYLTDGTDTTYIRYNNRFYLFTDGYLEYVDKTRNSQFYYGSSEIERVRKYCNAHNIAVADALETEPSLRLPPYITDHNKYISLFVLETHERDKVEEYQKYGHYAGLRDNEILEAVWRRWAQESGFKSFEWRKY